MAHLSIRLPDNLLADLNEWSEDTSKAEIIREALELYRIDQITKQKRTRLSHASYLVRHNSMEVNKEFQAMENDINEA